MKRSPSALQQHGPLAAHRLGDERERVLAACRVPWGGTARTPCRPAARRRGARWRSRRRWRPAGWWCSGRSARSRPWRARWRRRGSRPPAPITLARTPAQRPSSTMSVEHTRVSRARSTFLRRPHAFDERARHLGARRSPCACTMRRRECAASRPSLSLPSRAEVELRAPASCNSRTRSGPSSTSTSTASRSQSAAPAASVSCRCSSGRVAGAECGGNPALRVRRWRCRAACAWSGRARRHWPPRARPCATRPHRCR